PPGPGGQRRRDHGSQRGLRVRAGVPYRQGAGQDERARPRIRRDLRRVRRLRVRQRDVRGRRDRPALESATLRRAPPLPEVIRFGLIGLLLALALVAWLVTDDRMAGMDA